jgi:MFS family permease
MIMSPLSEFWGRRPIYLVSWAGFVIWTIPCAVARNISTMLVSRFMSGISASAFMSVAGGTIGDLFHREDLGCPMMIYSGSTFGGPSLGNLTFSKPHSTHLIPHLSRSTRGRLHQSEY